MEPVGWGVGVGWVFPGRKNFGPGGERPGGDDLLGRGGRKITKPECEALSHLLQDQKGQTEAVRDFWAHLILSRISACPNQTLPHWRILDTRTNAVGVLHPRAESL